MFIFQVSFRRSNYVVRAIDDEKRTTTVVDVFEKSDIRQVDTEQTWHVRANFNFRYSSDLGDAFVLGEFWIPVFSV